MKTRTFLAAVALVFVASSCAKEVAEAPAKLSEMTFTAGIDTRTVLTASYGVEWVANNSISVFDGVGNQQFTASLFPWSLLSPVLPVSPVPPMQAPPSITDSIPTALLPPALQVSSQPHFPPHRLL